MTVSKRTRPKRLRKRLYHSAKISERRFRTVLWHYVLDQSATETAKVTGLSVNSVAAIFRKLRVYFWDAGIFADPYEGKDPREFDDDNLEYERRLLDFHFSRARDKRGLKSTWKEPDYHLAESQWRFGYMQLMVQRPSADVHPMMMSHLLEIIRLCGPVGSNPVNRKVGLLAKLRHMDQMVLWLERNAPGFNSEEQRAELKNIRSIKPKR